MKRFLVILGLTALVWLGVSLSEEHEYPMRVRVQMTGYDTVRYALLSADTVLDVKVRMAGFNALLNTLPGRRLELDVDMGGGRRAVAVSDLDEPLRRAVIGARQVSSGTDSLRVVLAARASRRYRPRIDPVDFSFTEQHGLSGEPTVRPAEVVLYGPEEDLRQIDDLFVEQSSIADVSCSATYRLPLEPVWQRFPDVHPSVREVEVTVPVVAYVEREYSVAVSVEGADTSVTLRLYPDHVAVRAWVPQERVAHEPQFRVSVDYADALRGDGTVPVRLAEFPSHIRPRSVEPNVLQCVVIR